MPHSDAVMMARTDVRGLIERAADRADPADPAQVAALTQAYRNLQPDPADPADEALGDKLLGLITASANHPSRATAPLPHSDALTLADAYNAVIGEI